MRSTPAAALTTVVLTASLAACSTTPADGPYRLSIELAESNCKDTKPLKQILLTPFFASQLIGSKVGDGFMLSEPGAFDDVYKKQAGGFALAFKREERAFRIGDAKTVGAKIPIEVASVLRAKSGGFEEEIKVTIGPCSGENCSSPSQMADDLVRAGGPCTAVFRRTGELVKQ